MQGMVDVEERTMVLYENVRGVVGGGAVVVFTLGDCCMCQVAKQVLFGLGVGPTVIELGSGSGDQPQIQALLRNLSGCGEWVAPPQALPLPAIFVGGKFLGGIEASPDGVPHQRLPRPSPQTSRRSMALSYHLLLVLLRFCFSFFLSLNLG